MSDVLRINAPRTLILAADGDDHIEITNRTPFRLLHPVWDDLRFPAAGINPPGGASDATRNTSTGLLEFAAAGTNLICFQAQMPHAWKEGSAIEAHIHWMPSTTNGGNVVWQLDYKVIGINETLPGSYTTLNVTDAADGVANKHQLTELGEIALTGKTVSCMIVCILSRLGGDAADTFTGVAQLLEVDFHYQIDGFGSAEEYIK